MRRSYFGRQSTADTAFDIFNILTMVVVLVVVLYPLWFVVIASFSDPLQVAAGQVLLFPKGFTLEGYRMVLRDASILTGYRNTIFYTFLGTTMNIILTILAAYPLSRKDWVGKNFFTGVLTFTMFFSGGLIPTYLLMKDIGIVNTIWAMVVPGAISVYNVVVMRTFFVNSIPNELQEAAMVDGSSNFGLLLRIVIPLSKPIIAVLVMFYGVAHWNAFFNALIYITDTNLYPLQLILRSILIQNMVSQEMMLEVDTLANRTMMAELIKYALIIVATLPMLLLYPFLQRHFTKGVMLGALKG